MRWRFHVRSPELLGVDDHWELSSQGPPHPEQGQQGRIVNLPPVDHMEPFSPMDHMGPKAIIEEEIWEDVIPPAMVCGHLVFSLLADPMEGVLGDLENSPQCFFNQK